MIKKLYKKLVSERKRNKILDYIRKIKAIFLKGNQFYCVCCNKSFRLFLSKSNGIETRNHAICPNCGSLERTRLLYYYLKNETQIFTNQPFVLHIAPENNLKNHFYNNPNYFDVDINPDLATYQMDITKTTYLDNTFDYIICSHVLGHIKNEKKAIEELYRILKIGGTLITLTLLNLKAENTLENSNLKSETQKLENYGEKDLERLHGKDFIKRLEQPNVFVEEIDYTTRFTEIEKNKFALGNGKRELIFKSIKNNK